MPVGNETKLRDVRHIFSTADDEMIQRIKAGHSPEVHEVSPEPVLHLVQSIFSRAAPAVPGSTHTVQHQESYQAQLDAIEKKASENGFHKMLDLISDTINKLSSEMFCMCSGVGGDPHAKTWAMFNPLSNYSWGAKLVIALAAFAVNYGEFWLVAQLHFNNPLAKSVALIKRLPEQVNALTPKLEEISNLIMGMMDVTKSIVEFEGLPPHEEAIAKFPAAVYWTIRSLVACASQMTDLVDEVGHKDRTSHIELWELSSLASKVKYYRELLNEQLSLTYSHIKEKRSMEIYQQVLTLAEAPVHVDNMKFLKALINAKDGQLPLLNGSNRERASVDVLRRKHVLLLISDLEVDHGQVSLLQIMNREERDAGSRYEMVWLPVVDVSEQLDDDMERKFQILQHQMPWYSIYHPSLVDRAVIRFIKEVWHFRKEPMLVVIDALGKIVNRNAIHMMWIWGPNGFPYTSAREAQLWKDETLRIDFLLYGIYGPALKWMEQGKYICLYGGEDIEWIRSFTTAAKEVARTARIQLEMLYVGKSNPGEKVRITNATIMEQGFSDVLSDLTAIWFFWLRLRSMWGSLEQHNRNVENDQIMTGVMTILNYDASNQGWAVMGQRGSQLAKGKGDLILKSLSEYKQWEQKAQEQGFVAALADYLQKLHTSDHCMSIILPGSAEAIPERAVCAECGRPMEKFILYRCCID